MNDGKENKEINDQEFTESDKRYISREICLTTLKDVEEIWEMKKFDEIHISYELLQHSRCSIFCKKSNLDTSDTILFDDKSLYSIRNSIRSVLFGKFFKLIAYF